MIRYARHKLVRWYSFTFASSVIIFSNYHPVTLDPSFTLDFSQYIKTHTVADVQKVRIHDIFDKTRRPCVLWFAEPTKSVETCVMNMFPTCLPGHASNCPTAVTRYMVTGDDPCGLPDGLILK